LTSISSRAPLLDRHKSNTDTDCHGKLLAKYGTDEQKKEWLQPLLDGKIRSAYVMTEIDVAASDAKNLAFEMRREGDDYILNGVVSI
jgi:acyl-CoA dehydrogenase